MWYMIHYRDHTRNDTKVNLELDFFVPKKSCALCIFSELNPIVLLNLFDIMQGSVKLELYRFNLCLNNIFCIAFFSEE